MNRLFIPLLLVSLFTHGALSAQDKTVTKEKTQKEKTTTTTTTKTTLTPKKPVAPVAKPAAPAAKPAVVDNKKKMAEPAAKKAVVAPAKKVAPVAAKPAAKKAVAKKETTVVKKTVTTKKTVVKKTKTIHHKAQPPALAGPAPTLPMQEMAGPAELRNFDIDMENAGPAIVEIKNGSVMVNGRNVAGISDTRANLRITINPKAEKEDDDDDRAAAPKTAERESEHKCGEDNHCCHKAHMPSCETDRRHSVKYEYKTYRYKHPYYGRSW
jgi:hypothetical protein